MQTPHWTDRIYQDIQDPSWWFTAFIVAIVASVLAAYFKDAIGWAVSFISVRARSWRYKRKVKAIRLAIVIEKDVANVVMMVGITILYFNFLMFLIILPFLLRQYKGTRIGQIIPYALGLVLLAGIKAGWNLGKLMWLLIRVGTIKDRTLRKRANKRISLPYNQPR